MNVSSHPAATSRRTGTLRRHSVAVLWIAGVFGATAATGVAQTVPSQFEQRKAEAEEFFDDRVTPFIKTYCLECHSNRRPTEAGVNFSPTLKAPGHAAFSELWRMAAARVKAHDMPPEYMDEQPSDAERQMFVDWLEKVKFLSERDPGPFVIRRLTKTEYANTLHDLFGVDRSIADALPDEVSGQGYLNSLSPMQAEQYLSIADKVVDQIMGVEGKPDLRKLPAGLRKRLFRQPPASEARAAAREIAQALARKTYRRPPSKAEVDVLLQVYDLGRQNDLAYPQAIALMLKAILVSPQFLFITPAGEVESEADIVPLDDYQLASRLSYLLWATMPDQQLMSLAGKGQLREPAVLKAQVKRLLDDPRSRALFDGFGAQWLGLDKLESQTFDSAKFPQMTSEMRTAMYDEARLFFDSVVRENRSVISFVDCDYTYLNETLAPLYGLEEMVAGPAMRRVQLTDENRGGNVVPHPHQSGEARRVGTGAGARRTCAARPARRSGAGGARPGDGHESDPS